ncbi:uncharacterized protein N7496_008780 [Penicillium cataractarum]|uniref:Xylanolytic transcriptional activator regulatory domain-containing protein n=1 Tax=Penicillium cataractarum TaxID=2100454 RepID=A0A9W9RZ89_9EURO|nr:uncharacterized protein N7496_008780 [Penicillium cataractarum]KAJ5369020.1 hypothetical protein N7496_008780 [Penicillium cataractarum]
METLPELSLPDKQYSMANFDDTIPFAASARPGKRLRVARAFVETSHMNGTLQRNEHLEQQNVDVTLGTFAANLTSGNALDREAISRASPDAITDVQGHYVGPASGLSFLARVRKRLNFNDQASSSFTFGDAPMADHDPTPSIMISSEESLRLVERFFDFTVPIDRIVHRPTIDNWLREFQDTMGSMRDVENACAQRAILWMIFAMAQEHGAPERTEKTEDRSVRYFLAADYQLSKERGVDCRRRTFWSAYCLDAHLSLTLGRPRIFHDEDIDQELPSGADDSNLSDDALKSLSSHGYSKMVAPVAYYRLHRVLTGILRDLYSIRPVSLEKQCTLAGQYSIMLEEWRDSLPKFLQIDNGEIHPLIAIYQRQRDVLHYTYWHAMILTNRPLMLRGFTNGSESGTEMFEDGLMFRSFWGEAFQIPQMQNTYEVILISIIGKGTCYYGFAASVVLFVYTIQKAPSLAVEDLHHLETGARCLGHLATFKKHTPLVARYVLILEELQQEAQRRSEGQSTPSDCSITASYTDAAAVEYANIIGVRMPFPASGYEDFGGAPTDLASWMQFEPLPRGLTINSSFSGFRGSCSGILHVKVKSRGWGVGFLKTLTHGAIGVDLGYNGDTTATFVFGGAWANVIDAVTRSKASFQPYVTIQFGHNDQKSTSGVTLAEYATNLENMAQAVLSAEGIPILVTPLSRRTFNSTTGLVIEDLATQRNIAITVSESMGVDYIDLSQASTRYLDAIGASDWASYNRVATDYTHLNPTGSVVFGNMVSWLLLNSTASYIYPSA